eukprot:gene11555-12602_t
MCDLKLFLFGAFLLSSSAWLIQKPFVRPLSKTCRYYGPGVEELARVAPQLVIPGITIPVAQKELERISSLSNNVTQNTLLGIFAIGAGSKSFAGQLKSDLFALDPLQKFYVRQVVTNKADLPNSYKYFGNGNVGEILKQLLLTNPFYTSALQSADSGSSWTISSYAKNDSPTRYSKLITAYDASFPRVNVKLNRNTLDVTEYKVYDSKGNDITKEYPREEAIKLVLFLLTYYAEVVHASIHIYDYINVIGLYTSSTPSSRSVADWAGSYLSNVPTKYSEVETLLLSQNGALVSKSGFNADRTQVLQYIRDELLKPWLHFSTADQFVDKFVFGYIPKEQRSGLLKAFQQQVDLIPNFTSDLVTAIDKESNGQFQQINKNLEEYYRDLGNDISNIKDVGAWIQLMSILNIVHGSTFSFSRLIVTPQYLPYLDFSNTGKYTGTDVKIAITVLGTTLGLSSNRYVYTSLLVPPKGSDETIYSVLQRYDKASNDLKIKYFDAIKNDPKFAEYGWLWTDYGPDLIDNKQLTLATYV